MMSGSPIDSIPMAETLAETFGLSPIDVAPLAMPTDVSGCLFMRTGNIGKGKAKRQLEFESGRYCAGLSLENLGFDSTVGAARDRSPVWPMGATGSISHSDQFVWAVTGRTSDLVGIGVDTEPVADEKTLGHLKEEILNRNEERFGNAVGLTELETFTAIFSAKESLYKCVYPLEPVFFGFHDAFVTAMDEQTIQLNVAANSPNQFLGKQTIQVEYAIENGNVFSACWLRK